MKSIGNLLRDARVKKRYSKAKLEEKTKIKKEFVDLIEKERWRDLPDFPVVQGFVKSLSGALGIDQVQALALLRRDYPPKSLSVNPKPDIANKFSWNPRLTFLAGIVLAVIVVAGYLIFQYVSFLRPPALEVTSPADGQTIEDSKITVVGDTDPEASVRVNNQPALLDEEGNFQTQIEIFEGTTDIVVVAKSRSGKETIIVRKIKPELNKP